MQNSLLTCCKNYQLKKFSIQRALNKKHLEAHIRNMMEKLGVGNMAGLHQAIQHVKL